MKQAQCSVEAMKKKWEESTRRIECLSSALRGEKVRTRLLSLYAGVPYGERMIWHDLALFKETGPTGILAATMPGTLFDMKEGRLKERIFSLIKKLPHASLSDFREFVVMTTRVIERITYICTMALLQFTEREKGDERESPEIRPYTEYFTNKLFWEAEVLYELRHEKHMKDFCTKYEQWLCDKVLTEEVAG